MRKLLTAFITAIALIPATTVTAAEESSSNSFNVDGCTPGDISMTLPEQSMNIPTDMLVGSSTINLVIPFSVIETGGCPLDRGLTVQIDSITNIPSYLQLTSSDADRIYEGSLSNGASTAEQFQLTFNVTGTVPANDSFNIGMNIGAYSLLASADGTTNAGNDTQDTGLQNTLGSPVAPSAVSAPEYIAGAE